MTDRTQQSGTGKLPELLRLENGDSVNTTEDWKRRRTELLRLYSEYVYGCMPEKEKETLNWNLREDPETGGTLMTITVSSEGRSASAFPFWPAFRHGKRRKAVFPFLSNTGRGIIRTGLQRNG